MGIIHKIRTHVKLDGQMLRVAGGVRLACRTSLYTLNYPIHDAVSINKSLRTNLGMECQPIKQSIRKIRAHTLWITTPCRKYTYLMTISLFMLVNFCDVIMFVNFYKNVLRFVLCNTNLQCARCSIFVLYS